MMIPNKIKSFVLITGLTIPLLAACGPQHTPSMMNTSKIELSRETMLDQIQLKDLNEATLTALASHYDQNGNGPLDLTMTYDPKAKDFTAMKALHELKHVRAALNKKGVIDITTQTMAVPRGMPSLMVSYDVVKAQAPSDCTPMPGLDNNETGRFIGDYKFGCGVESLLAKQIARPTDLEGQDGLGKRDARRDSVMIEGYSAGVPNSRLEGVERGDLASE